MRGARTQPETGCVRVQRQIEYAHCQEAKEVPICFCFHILYFSKYLTFNGSQWGSIWAHTVPIFGVIHHIVDVCVIVNVTGWPSEIHGLPYLDYYFLSFHSRGKKGAVDIFSALGKQFCRSPPRFDIFIP